MIIILFLIYLIQNFASLTSLLTDPLEVQVLKDLYTSDNGPFWKWRPLSVGNIWIFNNESYSDPCSDQWQGITCVASTQFFHISEIKLDKYNLTGYIPTSLANLSYLLTLSCSENSLEGNIPPEISNLHTMQYLNLGTNRLTGSIPDEIYKLTSLIELHLEFNYFAATLSSNILSLRNLEVLNIQSNLLYGSIPLGITELRNLSSLNLCENHLTGTIPSSLSSVKNLVNLLLYSNLFNGTIPPSIGNLSELQYLYLYDNRLTGMLPLALSNLSQILYMGLNSNLLTGTIPPAYGNLSNALGLYLYSNMLTGNIPPTLSKMKQLYNLFLYSNRLTGSIPSSLTSLTKLAYLDLDDNFLSSSLPSGICMLNGLLQLFVARNQLTGTIPDCIGNLSQLNAMYMHENQFTGTLPSSFGNMSSLVLFYLYLNQLSGTLPAQMSTMEAMVNLIIYSNHLTGTIPDSFQALTALQQVFLSLNALSGPLDSLFQNKQALMVVQLRSNFFSGKLETLFTPSIIFIYLYYLDLSDNQLSGTIPNQLFLSTIQLEILSLTKNCFHGSLPDTLCRAIYVHTLDLGGLHASPQCQYDSLLHQWGIFKGYVSNSLSGSLPDCVWDLPILTALQLSGNGLSGNLDVLNNLNWSQSRIRNISLSYNLLSGTLPLSLQSDMRNLVLDLSYNRLKGSIDKIVLPNMTFHLNNSLIPFNQTHIDQKINRAIHLNTNRLSGLLPADFHTASDIEVLEGNLFSCSHFHQNAPIDDPYYNNYSCGSESLDNSFYAAGFVLGLGLILLGFLVYLGHKIESVHSTCRYLSKTTFHLFQEDWYYLRHLDFPRDLNPEAGQDAVKLGYYGCYLHSLMVMRLTAYFVCALSLLACLPLYVLFYCIYDTGTYAKYMNQYSWVTTSVYVTGDLPASLLLALWSVILFASICAILFSYQKVSQQLMQVSLLQPSEEDDGTSIQNKTELVSIAASTYSSSISVNELRVWVVLFLMITISIAVNLSVNIAYVSFISSRSSSSTLNLLLQIIMSIYKLLWNVLFVKRLIHLFPQNTSTITILLSMLVFNIVLAPALAASLFDSSCFKTLVFGSNQVVTNFTYHECILMTAWGRCDEHLDQFYSNSFYPGFIYSYNCASAILTSYIPVYIITTLIMILISPIFTLGLTQLSKEAIPGPIYRTLPGLIRPQDQGRCVSESNDSYTLFNIQFILMMNLVLLFTFGLTSPVLCLLLTMSILLNSYMWHIILQRFIYYDDQNSIFSPYHYNIVAEPVIELVENPVLPPEHMQQVQPTPPHSFEFDIQLVCKKKTFHLNKLTQVAFKFLRKSLYLLGTCCLVFYTFVSFDMVGDQGGFQHALWVIILLPILVVLLLLFIRIATKLEFQIN